MEAVVRPMTDADVGAAARVQVVAFNELTEVPTDEMWERIYARHRHFLTHDPGGCWVATEDDRVVGCALALKRDSLWGLSLLVVDPLAQSGGRGRALVDAALRHAKGCDRGIILSSVDVRAMRTYATSGFDLHPQVGATGEPRRSALPALGGRVRRGSIDHVEWANQVDRGLRGAGRGPDHLRMASTMPMFLVDDVDGRGYAYLRSEAEVYCLGATDEATATDLLWRCLAHTAELGLSATVENMIGSAQWAIRTTYAARLRVAPAGPVFWRGMTPPSTYLPSGAYL